MLYDDAICLREVTSVHQVHLIYNIRQEILFVIQDTTTFHILALDTTFTFIQCYLLGITFVNLGEEHLYLIVQIHSTTLLFLN